MRTPPPQQATQTTVYSHAQSNVQVSYPPVQGLGLGGMSSVVGVGVAAGAPFHLHRSSGAPLFPTSSRRMMAPPPEEGMGGMPGSVPGGLSLSLSSEDQVARELAVEEEKKQAEHVGGGKRKDRKEESGREGERKARVSARKEREEPERGRKTCGRLRRPPPSGHLPPQKGDDVPVDRDTLFVAPPSRPTPSLWPSGSLSSSTAGMGYGDGGGQGVEEGDGEENGETEAGEGGEAAALGTSVASLDVPREPGAIGSGSRSWTLNSGRAGRRIAGGDLLGSLQGSEHWGVGGTGIVWVGEVNCLRIMCTHRTSSVLNDAFEDDL
uniref:Uncharacterized protein n=1 Tax=Chromera velia CCMP2878 TaxID=1169474 RepID=A0A0G4FU69_9ALVE|eukprot:Cvel_18816.t1-p1 / transcript=Cvel_18816.t1 / gene=Cvel_18816 / organism=Chromera_velia_CCMP2878 / gene_product=hypothetical protein / transcript_product=hypothetical protein / location=Cvel_scaffold1580:20122-22782(-) / protein_length=322 / sequence_SO=supercontig / SO=protein_coding / is_pseudo=false